jgi:uncharacterized protein (DUF2062 family)
MLLIFPLLPAFHDQSQTDPTILVSIGSNVLVASIVCCLVGCVFAAVVFVLIVYHQVSKISALLCVYDLF